MAQINNFSLVGVGSSVKIGKGGGTISSSEGDLILTAVGEGVVKIGEDTVATESYVSTNYTPTDGLADYLTTLTGDDAFITQGDLDAALSGYLETGEIGVSVQAYDVDLTAIAELAGTAGLARKTGAGTWELDTATYLTTAAAGNTYLALTGGTLMGALTLSGTPENANHAATKAYVDGVAAGLSFKNSVRAATVANITLEDEQTIDDVVLVEGDRVLVKDQSDAEDNGIYIVVDSGPWTRSADAATSSELKAGTFVFVEEGTTFADTSWIVVTDNPIVVGTDPIEWTQYAAAGETSLTGSDVISVGSAPNYTVSVIGGTNGQVLKSGEEGAVAWGSVAYSEVTGKPSLATVATTGEYSDLSNKPTLVTNLADLADVDLTGVTDGDILVYNDGTWEVTAPAATPDASDIAYDNETSELSATDVQAAIDEIAVSLGSKQAASAVLEAYAGGDTPSAFTLGIVDSADAAAWRTAIGLANIASSGAASDVTFSATGGISAINVQSAIAELDSEKLALAGGTMSGAIAMGDNAITGLADPVNNQDAATKAYVLEAIDSAITGGAEGILYSKKVAFNFNTATTGNIITNLAIGSTIKRIAIVVKTEFDGTAPTVVVNNGTDNFAVAGDSDLKTAGTYIIDLYEDTTVDDTNPVVFAVTSDGSAAGAGFIHIDYTVA